MYRMPASLIRGAGIFFDKDCVNQLCHKGIVEGNMLSSLEEGENLITYIANEWF